MKNFKNAENKSECWWKQSTAVKLDCVLVASTEMLSLNEKDKQDLVLLFIGIVLINAKGVLEKPCKILHLNRKQMALNWACRWGNSGFLISLSQQNKKKCNALFVPFTPVCTGLDITFNLFKMHFNFFTHTRTYNKTTVWPSLIPDEYPS